MVKINIREEAAGIAVHQASVDASVDPTDAGNDIVGCISRSDRSRLGFWARRKDGAAGPRSGEIPAGDDARAE
jgi:hypothetical protein